MNKIISIVLVLCSVTFFSQKIGYIEAFNPALKHAHLKGITNMKLNTVEDLSYDIRPYIDSLFIENKINILKLNDFDESILSKFSPQYGNAQIESHLKGLCEKNNLDGILIFKSFGNKTNGNNMLATALYPELDFGVVSFENPKKSLFFYNNIMMLFYSKKEGKLRYPSLKKSDNLMYTPYPVKFDYTLYNENDKYLVKKNEVKEMFLKDFKMRLRLNSNKAISELRK